MKEEKAGIVSYVLHIKCKRSRVFFFLFSLFVAKMWLSKTPEQMYFV